MAETKIESLHEEAPMTFEQAMKRLEEIVRLLESGELSLDETIRLYEEGQRLRQFCEQKLNEAEKRIKTVMLTNNGNIKVSEFEPEF